MNKKLQHFASGVLGIAIMVFCGIGIQKTYEWAVDRFDPVSTTPSIQTVDLHGASDSAEFISGPLVADVGQLCVFTLDNPETRADWVIVPETSYYVDSSGSALAFASNVPAKYTIIAAVVEGGVPKILTHVCEYGTQPTPPPNPKPNPPPNQTLKDWVAQNIPDTGTSTAAALAACYESVAQEIEKGSILSQEAAFSALRTATQTKIDIGIWSGFLDTLSEKVTETLDGSTDIHRLGTIFTEIADGLRKSRKTSSTDRRKPR